MPGLTRPLPVGYGLVTRTPGSLRPGPRTPTVRAGRAGSLAVGPTRLGATLGPAPRTKSSSGAALVWADSEEIPTAEIDPLGSLRDVNFVNNQGRWATAHDLLGSLSNVTYTFETVADDVCVGVTEGNSRWPSTMGTGATIWITTFPWAITQPFRGAAGTEATYPGSTDVGVSSNPALVAPDCVVYLADGTSGPEVTVEEGGAITVISGGMTPCSHPVGCTDANQRYWVVFAAQADGLDSRIYVCWSDETGVWEGPFLVSETDPTSTTGPHDFPSIAVSGGTTPVVLVAWRLGDASSRFADVNILYRAAPVASLGSSGFPGAGIDQDTGEIALTAWDWRRDGVRGRDPCVCCTDSGVFFVGYTTVYDPRTGVASEITIARTEDPLDTTTPWTSETLPAIDAKREQDFVFICADEDAGLAVAVWEQIDGSGLKRTVGATCDLSTYTWTAFDETSDTDAGDTDQFPCCEVDGDGTIHVFYVRCDATTEANVRMMHRVGTWS